MRRVSFTTEPATLLRVNFDKREYHASEPFRQVVRIESEDLTLELPSAPESGPLETHETLLDKETLTRLFGYVVLRFLNPKAPEGNCHDFTSYMAGYDPEDWKKATRQINEATLASAELITDPLETPDGEDIIVVGHPHHAMVGPFVEGARHPDYITEEGHGPLVIGHSLPRKFGELGLQRMALGGPLGLVEPAKTLDQYRQSLPIFTHPEDWQDEQPPRPEDIDLYRIPVDSF